MLLTFRNLLSQAGLPENTDREAKSEEIMTENDSGELYLSWPAAAAAAAAAAACILVQDLSVIWVP